MKFALIFLFNLFLLTAARANSGILLLAHGSMQGHAQSNSCHNLHPSSWERAVLKSVESIRPFLDKKVEVAFGMWNTKCIDAGIERLQQSLAKENLQLQHLIVFPLFISSYSAVIEMQKFILKKRPDRAIPLPHVKQTKFDGRISYLTAIDYNPHIAMILSNRFHHLIHMAKDEGLKTDQMELVLVMHGPVKDEDNIKWMEMGEKYIRDIQYLFPVKKSHIISLRDDAPPPIRDQATQKLRSIVSNASQDGAKALILPLLLAQGGIEAGILQRLEGLDFLWSGQMLLPDQKLNDLLIERLHH